MDPALSLVSIPRCEPGLILKGGTVFAAKGGDATNT